MLLILVNEKVSVGAEMYLDSDGSEITLDEIKAAVRDGTARLIHSHGDGRTLTSLKLVCEDIDTRGECYSVWDERWTTVPTLNEAVDDARVKF